MFKVDIPRKEETVTYYVFDEKELVQPKILANAGAIFMNTQKIIINSWDTTDMGLFIMFTNPLPVMVLESDISYKTINYNGQIIPMVNKDFIDTISISKEDYNILYELSKEQYKDPKLETAKEDIETAKKLVKQKNPNHGKNNPCGFV